jgi:hypothetical protein
MITFHPEKHEYFNDKNEKYISVSGLAHLLEEPVDWTEKAKNKSKNLKKEGIIKSYKELLAQWDKKRNLGSTAGTIIHDIRERELLNTQEPTFYNSKCKLIPCSFINGVKKSLSTKKLENNTVYPELIIYNHDYKICGQSDKVIVTNKTLHVHDYKTDEEIKRKGFSTKWTPPETLLPPVNHLQNCNFNLYSIKMSMYMYLLWVDNKHLKIGDLILDHLQLERDDDGIPVLYDGKPKIIKTTQIKVPYLRKEVKDILNWYKQGKLQNGR